jgi:hypothetical protein
MKPIYDSLLENDHIRDFLNLDSEHEYVTDSGKTSTRPKLKKSDEVLRQSIAAMLFEEEHTLHTDYPNDDIWQNKIINEINNALTRSFPRNPKRITEKLFLLQWNTIMIIEQRVSRESIKEEIYIARQTLCKQENKKNGSYGE